jgi:hypothetical protein
MAATAPKNRKSRDRENACSGPPGYNKNSSENHGVTYWLVEGSLALSPEILYWKKYYLVINHSPRFGLA